MFGYILSIGLAIALSVVIWQKRHDAWLFNSEIEGMRRFIDSRFMVINFGPLQKFYLPYLPYSEDQKVVWFNLDNTLTVMDVESARKRIIALHDSWAAEMEAVGM